MSVIERIGYAFIAIKLQSGNWIFWVIRAQTKDANGVGARAGAPIQSLIVRPSCHANLLNLKIRKNSTRLTLKAKLSRRPKNNVFALF